jgi:8-oxo-dGTP diphosphatase
MIFVNSANQVLLFLRDNKPEIPFPNQWDLLGGGVEEGECPEECLRRELLEEIEYDPRHPLKLQVFDNGKWGIVHIFWQRAEFDLGRTPLHEGQKLRWFSEAEIRALSESEFAFGFRKVVLGFYQEVLAGQKAKGRTSQTGQTG